MAGFHRWMGGRAVEGSGLENRQGCKPLMGSNPTPSAKAMFAPVLFRPRLPSAEPRFHRHNLEYPVRWRRAGAEKAGRSHQFSRQLATAGKTVSRYAGEVQF